MMKKLLVFMMVFGMASAANASLLISVDGVVDPPDTDILVTPDQQAILDIHGLDNAEAEGFMGMLLIQGLGSIDASVPTNLWADSLANNMSQELKDIYIPALVDLGYSGVVDIIEWEIKDLTEPFGAPNGLLIDNLIFRCEGLDDPVFGNDVILTLVDYDLNVFDSQIIHQGEIPEPATIALLGLGGLLLRRRR